MMRQLACAGLLAASSLAVAQTSPAPAMAAAPAPNASPAKKELVAKVIALQQPAIDAIANSLAQQPLARMLLAANQALQTRVAGDKRNDVAKEIDAQARKYLDEVTPLLRQRAEKLAPGVIAPILEQHFNEDELRQIAAWLESPVNKKYQRVAPEVQSAFGQRLLADARGDVEPKLKALEARIATMLGLPARKPAASQPAAAAASGAPATTGKP
jgi:hypothetical protein